jgi:hypothetical protein
MKLPIFHFYKLFWNGAKAPFTPEQLAVQYQLPLEKVEEMIAEDIAAGYFFTMKERLGYFLTQEGFEALYVIKKRVIYGN